MRVALRVGFGHAGGTRLGFADDISFGCGGDGVGPEGTRKKYFNLGVELDWDCCGSEREEEELPIFFGLLEQAPDLR